MQKLNIVDMAAFILVIVGGLNWGLVGLTGFNVVDTVFGPISRLIYILVGVAAVYLAIHVNKFEKN